MKTYEMYIDGTWVAASAGQFIETDNPATGEPWARIPRGTAEDAERAVQAASRALKRGPWREMTATQRGALLRKLGDRLAAKAEHLAEVEVRDNGKLMSEMLLQMTYLPQWFYYYGGLADKIEGSVLPVDKPGIFNYRKEEPVGVVVAITPWNSPLILTACKIAPALAAGCSVVLKPSEYTSASALELMAIAHDVGFPDGVINVVTGYGAEVGEALVGHPLVAKIAFTGGEAGGRRVNEVAGRDFKSVVLELGGKSPNIVFDDAILEDAVNGAISGIFAASGQTCIAGSRLLVQRTIHDAFVEKLVEIAGKAKVGDPLDASSQIGPITTQAQYRKILDYIEIGKAEGASCVLGGRSLDRPGWFVEPTIFTGVNNKMRIAQEEVFGPVLSIIPFDDEDEAIEIANDTPYGLAAGIWTQNMGRAFKMIDAIEAGSVWVNTYRAVSFITPFGGYKRSGIGRENGMIAIREYLQSKSAWINYGNKTANPFMMRI